MKWIRMGCALATVLATVSMATEEVLPPETTPRDGANSEWLGGRLKLTAGTWISRGEGRFEISFSDFDPSLGLFEGSSELEWKTLDSALLILGGEYTFNDWLSIAATYGTGGIEGGSNTDTDGFEGVPVSVSEADTDGDVEWIDVVVYAKLKPLSAKLGAEVEVFAGYMSYSDALHDFNGVQTFSIDESFSSVGPFDGLDSTYSFNWDVIKAGARIRRAASQKLSLLGSLALLSVIHYDGDGYWNLRDDFRSTSPNFEQEADGGYGLEARAGVAYAIAKHVQFEIGWWYFNLTAEDGVDRTYFADGTEADTQLDEVESSRGGVFVALTYEL